MGTSKYENPFVGKAFASLDFVACRTGQSLAQGTSEGSSSFTIKIRCEWKSIYK